MFHYGYLRTSLAAAVLSCCAVAQAQNITLTFDDMATTKDVLPYGLQLSHTTGNHAILEGNSYLNAPVPSGKFLAYYSLESQSESIFLTPGSVGTFALNSLDLAGLIGGGGFQQSDKLSIQITGVKLDGTEVVAKQSFSLSAGSFVTFGSQYFSGFTGLRSVKFSGTGKDPLTGLGSARYAGVDNVSLTITPVPEPETYALLLVGLGVVAAVTRKRKTA